MIREFQPELSARPLAHMHCYVMIAREWKRGGYRLRYIGAVLRAGLIAPKLIMHLDELQKRRRMHRERLGAGA